MKFLVDAQLPPSLALALSAKGHDAIHTMDLPLKNDTPDEDINIISLAENRILITKDTDFYHSFILHQKPHKLLLIRTGNTRMKEIKILFETYFEQILDAFQNASLVELTRESLDVIL